MATVTINGSTYKGVRAIDAYVHGGTLETRTKSIDTDVKYVYNTKLRMRLESEDGAVNKIEVSVPNWLRVEVTGNIGYLLGSRVEVLGKVEKASAKGIRCTGEVQKLVGVSGEKYKFNSTSKKIKSLKEILKDNGEDLGRATVLQIDGDLKELLIYSKTAVENSEGPDGDDVLEYYIAGDSAFTDVIVKGNVTELECPGTLGVKGDIGTAVANLHGSFNTMPEQVSVIYDSDALDKAFENTFQGGFDGTLSKIQESIGFTAVCNK